MQKVLYIKVCQEKLGFLKCADYFRIETHYVLSQIINFTHSITFLIISVYTYIMKFKFHIPIIET